MDVPTRCNIQTCQEVYIIRIYDERLCCNRNLSFLTLTQLKNLLSAAPLKTLGNHSKHCSSYPETWQEGKQSPTAGGPEHGTVIKFTSQTHAADNHDHNQHCTHLLMTQHNHHQPNLSPNLSLCFATHTCGGRACSRLHIHTSCRQLLGCVALLQQLLYGHTGRHHCLENNRPPLA